VALTGYSTEDLDGTALRTATLAIVNWLRLKALVPPARTLLPLHQAAEAHARLERRSVDGRVLLVPSLALFKALPEPPARRYLGE
jgi:hypothetical protein